MLGNKQPTGVFLWAVSILRVAVHILDSMCCAKMSYWLCRNAHSALNAEFNYILGRTTTGPDHTVSPQGCTRVFFKHPGVQANTLGCTRIWGVSSLG